MRQNCTIHAFEPNPVTLERFKKNLALNQTRAVVVHNLAVSDREGYAALVETQGHSGAAYLTAGHDVEVVSLDQFCERYHIDRVDVIKVDAEGSEFAILRGAADTLSRFRPKLLMELNTPALDRQGAASKDVLSLLMSSGYRVYRTAPYREIPSADTEFVEQVFNVFATPGDPLTVR